MLHQSPPSKFHQNPLSHLLNLHSNETTATGTLTGPVSTVSSPNHHSYHNIEHIGLNQQHLQKNHQTIDVVNEQIGKSFTIAAILGLKKNVAAVAAAAAAANINSNSENNNNSSFCDVMNLSLNTTDNGKFDLHRIGQHYSSQIHHSNNNSALQSLQQLHQHHTSSNFHTKERQRENSGKKSSLKSKRVRTIFTPEQLERLEAEFERQQYMVGPERLYLAHTLQLTEAQVKVWFQNRRIKWRKHHLEITHQRLALLRQRQISTTIDHRTNNHHVEAELTICSDSMDTRSTPDIENDS